MLFLTLFCCAFSTIISFSFYKNYRSILEFSLGTIERVAGSTLERIKAFVIDAEQLLKIAGDLFKQLDDLSLKNKYLLPFLINAVGYDPNFAGFYIGTKEGNFIGATNIILSGQKFYLSDPKKLLDKETRYTFLVLDKVNPSFSRLEYKNEKFQTITSENLPKEISEFDPRTRPWYKSDAKKREFYLTDEYRFLRYQGLGMTISFPLFSKNEELLGFAGVDLSVSLLSHLLAQQKISPNGKVFILNKKGKILVAPQDTLDPASKDLLVRAFQHYMKDKRESFLIDENEVKYLVNMHAFALDKEHDWLITVIAPLSDFFADAFQTQKQVLLITIGILIVIGWLVFLASKRISSPIVNLATEVDKISQLNLESKNRVHSNIREIQLMDISIAKLRIAIHSFARYVPRRVVQLLMLKGEEISIGGEKKEMSVFFSDISGFTSIAERHPVEFIVQLLSEYFAGLSNIILSQEGVIDKFIGDSVMAFWGAPIAISNHALKSCTAALLCQDYLKGFNQNQRKIGGQELITRIAINSGLAFAGNIGAAERMNYTVIGDVVNAAAHLQSINKTYHTQINITEETYKRAEKHLVARPLDVVEMKGRKEKMKIYELVALKRGDSRICATQDQIELCKSFLNAYEMFHNGQLQKAKDLFQAIAKKFPDDFPTQIYLKRFMTLSKFEET